MTELEKMAEEYAEKHAAKERQNMMESPFTSAILISQQDRAIEMFKSGLIRVYMDGFKAAREMAATLIVERTRDPKEVGIILRLLGEETIQALYRRNGKTNVD